MTTAHKGPRVVADRLIALLDSGVRPWIQPWRAPSPHGTPRRHCGKPYRGINILILGIAAVERGVVCPLWMTRRQGVARGGWLRKGARCEWVFLAGSFVPRHEQEAVAAGRKSAQAARRIFSRKPYAVFNGEEVDGLDPAYRAVERRQPLCRRLARAEAFFAALPGEVQMSGNRAFHAPGPDVIRVPPSAAFDDAQALYSCLGHEYVHWTGAPWRLDRKRGQRGTDEDRACEELRAEIGAVPLCLDLDIAPGIREGNASHIGGWIQRLGADPSFIFRAASQAQTVVDHLIALAAAGGWTPAPADANETTRAATDQTQQHDPAAAAVRKKKTDCLAQAPEASISSILA